MRVREQISVRRRDSRPVVAPHWDVFSCTHSCRVVLPRASFTPDLRRGAVPLLLRRQRGTDPQVLTNVGRDVRDADISDMAAQLQVTRPARIGRDQRSII